MSTTKDVERITAVANQVHLEALNEKVAQHAENGDDETARYAAAHAIEIDDVTNKRLFWKINKRILVVMVVTYFCQSLDKGTLNFASIMGIQKDANLKGQEVSPTQSKILDMTALTTRTVQLARNYFVHGHSRWRVSAEFSPTKIPGG